MATTLHLGFEVGTGKRVEIPMAHMAVTGMTQQSGKTTTLEALVRSGGTHMRALAFVTKRGESAFAEGRRVRPYFRDRADWQFVSSIIDATLQEKNKFLRPWIMKICRTTRTLAEVQREVRKALEKAKGINEGVYTQLDAYLDLIVPEIDRADLAPRLDLAHGLNVMDVSASPTPMQMLFVQSALDWINERAEDTTVIIPEAWEFIPEGKGSPVKASAVTLVRKGAALRNHIWLDSQDMAGVDKTMLRGCTVWLIGVQREANEIKRNLANIPASIKRPSAAAIAMLERGQFYACWGKHAIQTYVKPSWMEFEDAREVALGRVPPAPPPAAHTETEDNTVDENEARELRAENRRLQEVNRSLDEEVKRLAQRVIDVEPPAKSSRATADLGGDNGRAASAHYAPDGNWSIDEEGLYLRFLNRLKAEDGAKLLRVLVTKPELRVDYERVVVNVKGDTLRGRIARLLAAGFFDAGATAPATQKELARRGNDPGPGNVYKELAQLAVDGFLTIEVGRDERSRTRKEFHAVKDMKVQVVER